jgi:hypothetical protein
VSGPRLGVRAPRAAVRILQERHQAKGGRSRGTTRRGYAALALACWPSPPAGRHRRRRCRRGRAGAGVHRRAAARANVVTAETRPATGDSPETGRRVYSKRLISLTGEEWRRGESNPGRRCTKVGHGLGKRDFISFDYPRSTRQIPLFGHRVPGPSKPDRQLSSADGGMCEEGDLNPPTAADRLRKSRG